MVVGGPTIVLLFGFVTDREFAFLCAAVAGPTQRHHALECVRLLRCLERPNWLFVVDIRILPQLLGGDPTVLARILIAF